MKLQIKDMFQKRPLYVMMEEQLGCNPLCDHKVPKDVFPLYQGRLDSLFQAFDLSLNLNVNQLLEKMNDIVDTQLLSKCASLDDSQLTMNALLEQQSANSVYQLQFSKQIENMFGQMRKTI